LLPIIAATSLNLTCTYQTSGGTYNEVVLAFYLCSAPATFVISQPMTSIASVNDDTNKDLVEAFQANDITLKYFPINLGDFFTNLIYISVINSKLLEIRRESIEKFEKLRVIYLCNNNLEFIERDLFEGNKLLSYVYLNDNNFKFIDRATFDGLFYLEFLSMETGGCVNERATNRHAIIDLAKRTAQVCKDRSVIEDLVKRDQREFLDGCGGVAFRRACKMDTSRKTELLRMIFEEECGKLE
jgi:hypothetical protein